MDLDALRTMFLVERARFAALYPDCAKASLRLKRFKLYAARDCCMAVVGDDRPVIYFHTDVLPRLNQYQCRALIRHELAHAASPDLTEAETDALAEDVTGSPIYYGPDDIQTTRWSAGCSRRRPVWLPQG